MILKQLLTPSQPTIPGIKDADLRIFSDSTIPTFINGAFILSIAISFIPALSGALSLASLAGIYAVATALWISARYLTKDNFYFISTSAFGFKGIFGTTVFDFDNITHIRIIQTKRGKTVDLTILTGEHRSLSLYENYDSPWWQSVEIELRQRNVKIL